MKPILHVSDLHAKQPWFDWLVSQSRSECWGAIVIAGDLLDMFVPPSQMRGQISRVCASLAGVSPGIPLLICTGNHDHIFGETGNTALWLRSFAKERPSTYIDGQIAILGGKSFEIVGWNQAPRTAADFYVMHNPPEGAKTAISDGRDWGDFLFAEHLEVHGGIALTGHVHSPVSWFDNRSGKQSFNPVVGDSCLSKSEAPPFISIDLVRGVATRAGEMIRI